MYPFGPASGGLSLNGKYFSRFNAPAQTYVGAMAANKDMKSAKRCGRHS
jgi:hypothetical protein